MCMLAGGRLGDCGGGSLWVDTSDAKSEKERLPEDWTQELTNPHLLLSGALKWPMA